MAAVGENVYVGIDLNDHTTMISAYQLNMREPETLSTVVGSEVYAIPTILAKRKGIGQWFFGNEARTQAGRGTAELTDDLLSKALNHETVMLDGISYEGRDLLVIFLKKVLALSQGVAMTPGLHLILTVDTVSVELVKLLEGVAQQLEISRDRLLVIDHSEAFYYYALNQAPALFVHDVALFHYDGKDLQSCLLNRNQRTSPQVISLERQNHGKLLENRDFEFDDIVTDLLEGRMVSAVYLIGEGFEGEWMKASLQTLCKGRRVFMGKNLYSKGACYGGAVRRQAVDWPYIYMGDNELKLNLSIKVSDGNEMRFLSLLTAGDGWYDAHGECEVILDGSPEVEMWVQRPDSRDAKVTVWELTDLPKRNNRMTRLRIEAKAISDTAAEVSIRDLGFGELAVGSGKVWKESVEVSNG